MSRRGILAAALAAMLAGCGGGDGGGGGDGKQPAGSLEDQLGFGYADSPEAQAKVENDIAACMKAQGFEYTPVDPEARRASLTRKANLSDEDFTDQFGYGIATLYGRATAQSDPNARRRSGLGPAERRAYDRALSGGKPEQTFFRAADTGDFSQLGGCTKQAADRLFGGGELLAALQRKMDQLDEAVLQDQRMVRAYEAWTSCMRAKTGETFEDSEDVELEIQQRLANLVGPLPSGESAPGEFAGHKPKRRVDARALAELRRTEVEFAKADGTCEEEHLEPVEEVVEPEKERAFREANPDLLRKVKPRSR
jgi:hypothetical protein